MAVLPERSGGLLGSFSQPDDRDYAAKLYRATNYSHAAGWNKVPIDSVHYDPTGRFLAVSNRYVVKETGLYQVWGHVESGLNNNPQRFIIEIRKNGLEDSFVVRGNGVTIRGGTSGDTFNLISSGDMRCKAGDYIELWFFNSGGNTTTVAGNASSFGAQLSVRRIGPIPKTI